jgi:hypothetical protein
MLFSASVGTLSRRTLLSSLATLSFTEPERHRPAIDTRLKFF